MEIKGIKFCGKKIFLEGNNHAYAQRFERFLKKSMEAENSKQDCRAKAQKFLGTKNTISRK